MKVTLGNIEHSPRMSEETTCFCADVYVNGEKRGIAENSGKGGETILRGDFKDLEEYADKLPEREVNLDGHGFSYKLHAHDLVEDALHDWLVRKDFKKMKSKYILFTKEGQSGLFQYPKKARGQATVGDSVVLPAGCTNINIMPEDEALKIFKERLGA